MADELKTLTVYSKGPNGEEVKRELKVTWERPGGSSWLVSCDRCLKTNAEFDLTSGRLYCPECLSLEFLRS